MKDINELLKEHNLSYFKYYEDKGMIVYTRENGTSVHMHDFKKLIGLLNDNNIKHEEIGLDVVMIEKD